MDNVAMLESSKNVNDFYNNDRSEVLIPIEHSLVDGVYTRIAYAKAGTIIAGCPHLKGGTAILLSGSIQQIDGEEKYEISGPRIFNTTAGSQRIAKVLTDCVYATCHCTEAKTVEEAEELLFVGVPQLTRIRKSYNSLLIELKTSDKEVQDEMDNTPYTLEETNKYHIEFSIIHGKGCYASASYKKEDEIGVAIKNGERFGLARFVNHSDIPNCAFYRDENDTVILKAIRNINEGVELLVDYRKEKICQQ